MRKFAKPLAVAGVAIIGLAAAPALLAHDSAGDGRSMMGRGMMGGGMMGQGRMMGRGGMMGQMGRMMETCNKMMQGMMGGGGRPNEKWRKEAPKTPEKKG